MTAMTRTITILPIDFSLDNYKLVLANPAILRAFFISVSRTVIGVSYTLLVTGLAAYAVSKEWLAGRRFIVIYLIIPMYISGGLIPYYVLIHQIGLFNNFLVYILPHGFWAFNMLIMRTFFQTIPPSLEESASLDGAGPLTIFIKIIIPLSMPIVATISIFVGVFQWNSWFDGMLFITKKDLVPMQTFMQRLLMENFTTDILAKQSLSSSNITSSPESVKMSMIIVTTFPVLTIYPFFQKYFIKGVMIGAVKA
jgi:putative aldouronate transport system permease protein